VDAGRRLLPWWSDPTIHIDFARPLTALTHVLDYALWPGTPALRHLHSLLWFALEGPSPSRPRRPRHDLDADAVEE
jgi:hypothetical protein